MNSKHSALLLGFALIAGASTAANAADLYDGSIKDSYAPMAAASPSIYLRIDGGYAINDYSDITEEGHKLTNTDIDNTWTIGGGIGRYFGSSLRADITYDHRFEADVQGDLCDCTSPLAGTRKFGLENDVVLFNAYYDFNRMGRFNPYLGAGIGLSVNQTTKGTVETNCGCVGSIDENTDTEFAAAFMAGFSAKLRGGETVMGGIKDAPVTVDNGHALYLDVGYRFLYMGDASTGAVKAFNNKVPVAVDPTVEDLVAHEFRVGLRYDLR